MKKFLFTIAAIVVATIAVAQEYMVIENHYGGLARYDVSLIKQAYFTEYLAVGTGTKVDPFNVAAANAKCKEIGEQASAEKYYVKGFVHSVTRIASGIATFYLADDAKGINRIYAYQIAMPSNLELNRGDNVIVYVSLYNYNNTTPEMIGDIYAINGQTYEDAGPQGSGTLDNPYNVAAVVNYVNSLGADVESPNDIYFTGTITEVTEAFSTQYGNATFKIADGENGLTTFMVYRCLYIGNVKYNDNTALNIKAGDRVLMCGKVVNYKGTTPESVQGKAYVVSINGQTGGGETGNTGTATNPLTASQAYDIVSAMESGVVSTADYYIKGKISSIKYTFSAQYGTATFYITDDGAQSDKQFTAYACYYLGNQAWVDGNTQIAVGDNVILCGKVINYNGNTPETATQQAYIYSLNGTTGGGDTPQPSGHGTAEAPLTVAQAIALIDAESVIDEAYVKGKISQINSYNATYKCITYYISDDGSTTTQLQVYSGKGLNGADFTAKEDLTVGQTVVVKGKLKMYNTIYEFDKNSIIISIDGQGGGGSETTPTGTGTQADPFNIAAAIAKCKEVGQTASTEKYYIKGIVESEYTVSSYKNATFYLIDHEGDTEKLMAYRVKGTDGKDLMEGYTIPKGAIVIIYGPLVNYKDNTPETATGAYIVSVNGQAPQLDGESGGGSTGGDVATSLTNGNFETWANGLPTGWKSASTASSATLEQSTDAHGGSYACIVKGDASANKRLASQEIKLAAGSYNFSFWVKPTTENKAQVRPAYVPVTDGAVGSYKYGDYATLNAGWQQVSYDFTLDAETTICLVVMNPKASNYSSGEDVIVDDATLTKK